MAERLDSLPYEELERVTGGTDIRDKMLKCEGYLSIYT